MTTQPTEEELKRLVWDKGSKKHVEPKDLPPPNPSSTVSRNLF